jgi:hypothetical protein
MSSTSSSLAPGRAAYGDVASNSECPRQQILGGQGGRLGGVGRHPKNSSKCDRGAGSTPARGRRILIPSTESPPCPDDAMHKNLFNTCFSKLCFCKNNKRSIINSVDVSVTLAARR